MTPSTVTMTSDGKYLELLPDYVRNDVKLSSAAEQHHGATDDNGYEVAKVKSQDVPLTSSYEHPQLSETAAREQHQLSTYQQMITSQRLPSNDPKPVTSDMTYDEIADIPLPPPPRPAGWSALFSINCFN